MSGLIDTGATKLYYEMRGSGPPLLLITGGAGDAGEWAAVAPGLADGHTVITYDRRGMSRSPRPDGWTATSISEQAYAGDDQAAAAAEEAVTAALAAATRPPWPWPGSPKARRSPTSTRHGHRSPSRKGCGGPGRSATASSPGPP